MVSNTTNEKFLNVLKNVKIFYHIPVAIIEQLAQKMVVKQYAPDEPVFRKGDQGDCIYIITEGKVKLHEQEMIIAEMGVPDFFGEFSLLDNEPRSLSVTCTLPSKLAALHRNDFYLVLKEHPESIKNIIEALIKRIREQNNKIFTYLKNREKELEEEVSKKTADLRANNAELSLTLERLKLTQQQLVMKEMLASMGQLTAGIAHTLKNPLNFVNNFSQVSLDLISEVIKIKDETEKKDLLKDLKVNIEKINAHGKRANSIVENMLQHSTHRSGEKQQVNLNELTEEISHIAFHNYRSNNTGFTCEIKKNLKPGIPEVLVFTKEISRVLLNLLNNSFYSVEEKRKISVKNKDYDYNPLIVLSTYSKDGKVVISVKDNGMGIRDDIKERIFEPFFTTKPPEQGNGLGLSMSNEIIKMYEGEILLNNSTKAETEFLIYVPE
ncbi:MAG: cyclic nucleotide-binding domain-containing protein [Bacteroidia bacterium]